MRLLLPILPVALSFLGACATDSAAYKLADSGHKLVIEIDGEPFAEYRYENFEKPILYPLLGPGGVSVTLNFPMLEGMPGESADHPHHESLWFAHGDVNGYDFWQGSDAGEHIVHDRFERLRWKNGRAVVRSRNLWLADDRVLCTEERTMSFGFDERGRVIDFTFVLSPTFEPLVFGDTKEGLMALRLAPQLRLKGPVAGGHCLSSTGARDDDCWGKRAGWMAYWGELGGETISVVLFDHPDNPRHPAWWHARDYGLFAANPFGVHDFEGKPEGTGDLRLELGESLTFRYRLRIHTGGPDVGALDREFRRYGRLGPLERPD